MTYKNIEYSAHAARRMWERGVRRADVRRVLARWVWSSLHTPPLERRDPRFSKRGVIGRRELEVVYTEDAHRICVITVIWKD